MIASSLAFFISLVESIRRPLPLICAAFKVSQRATSWFDCDLTNKLFESYSQFFNLPLPLSCSCSCSLSLWLRFELALVDAFLVRATTDLLSITSVGCYCYCCFCCATERKKETGFGVDKKDTCRLSTFPHSPSSAS